MKLVATIAVLALTTAGAAFAGDVSKGAKEFKKCKSCHMVKDDNGEVIFKGGKTGPNLYGMVGSVAGSGDFRYSKALKALNEQGHVWDEESLAAFMTDNKKFLKEKGITDKSKMSFKMRKNADDVAAYLAQFTR